MTDTKRKWRDPIPARTLSASTVSLPTGRKCVGCRSNEAHPDFGLYCGAWCRDSVMAFIRENAGTEN